MTRIDTAMALRCGGLTALLVATAATGARAQAQRWPREIPGDPVTVVIYQPQPDSLVGNKLYGRAAMSLERKGQEPIFGVFWMTAQIQTDRDTREARVTGVDVTDVRWPDAKPDQQKRFSDLVEKEVPKWDLPLSMEQLTASLAASEEAARRAGDLRSPAPEIVVSDVPAVLVVLDGEPIQRKIEKTDYERVVNTPFAILYDPGSKTYYLSNGWDWYAAPAVVKGPWTYTTKVPADLKKLVPPDSTTPQPEKPGQLKILVATKPTELVSFEGTPAWTPLAGTDFLYAKNTESAVLRMVSSQDIYVLLSGRWFRTRDLKGPWTFVEPAKLPPEFAKIPPNSDMGDVLSSVPGTPQAEDAVRDAQMPQTAAIVRSEAKLTVQYDGEPKFVDIPGTTVKYAENTSTQVLLIDKRYYAVDNAVWFTSASAKGPWVVSDSVPAAVKTIPPSSPVYNVQYVQVYQATPQVVYVGYTPGYMGFYPYYGTVIYGTGWYYRPYVSPYYYYPRPVTYGFHVSYNPYTGWGFGITASNGFMSVGIHFGGSYYRGPCCYHGGGWYGYGGYRPPPPGYRPPPGGYRPPAGGNRPGAGGGARPTPYPSQRPANMYADRANSGRVAPGSGNRPSTRPATAPATPSTRPNNVYSDRQGNVYRQNTNGSWDQRQGNNWSPSPSTGARPSTPSVPSAGARPSQQPARTPTAAPSTQQLNRDAAARSRGAQMSGGGGRSYGGGGGRAGGGGRRR